GAYPLFALYRRVIFQSNLVSENGTQRGRCPERPNELRMFERSRFSRRFINVRKVLRIRAFRSSVRCSPLVATRASRSPCSVMNFIISRWRSCGALPNAVSRRISEHPASSESVKCSTHRRCSASAGGESFLHPEIWQDVPMGTKGAEG